MKTCKEHALATLLKRAGAELGGRRRHGPPSFATLEAELPDADLPEALLTMTYMGYYSRPEMRAKVCRRGRAHPVHPEGYDRRLGKRPELHG